MQNIQLSDHFTYRKLLLFSLPSVGMMIFTSIYGVIDGFFVSNFTSGTDFAALNYIYPALMILGTVGFMFGAGGSALVSKILGEGDRDRANRAFTLLVLFSAALGIALGILGILLMRPIALLLGAEGEMLERCVIYGRIVASALPFFVLQMEFQSFFVAAEKPKLGFLSTLAAGCTNILLDALFVAAFSWGLEGAALATALSQAVGGIFPLFYFSGKNTGLLRFVRTRWDGGVLWRTAVNGSSEFMSNVSMSLVSMIYNAQLYAYAGEMGVSAYGVIMYVSMIFMAAFIGYMIGTAPIVGYHFGAQNTGELRSILKKSVLLVGVTSLSMALLSELLSYPLSALFVGRDPALLALTVRAFRIFSISYLFIGYAIWGSGFFTALNDGVTSAIISFLRTLVFQVLAVLLLPLWLGVDGIWISLIFAEAMAVVILVLCLFLKRRKYQYF